MCALIVIDRAGWYMHYMPKCIFQSAIPLLSVFPYSHTCHVVNNSAAQHVQQPQVHHL